MPRERPPDTEITFLSGWLTGVGPGLYRILALRPAVRLALGMFAIVGGALVLSWQGEARFGGAAPNSLVLAACLAWAIDNNTPTRPCATRMRTCPTCTTATATREAQPAPPEQRLC